MKIKVTKDLCEIKENEIWNVGDYNVHTVQVELSPEFNGLVNKVRYFVEDKSYDMLITDNVAQVPYEATVMEGTIKIGVYGYDADTDILVQSTSPVNKYITSGTYTGDADNTEPLTPTDKEQMETAIQKNTDDITDLQNNKQNTLISGQNIKTINNESILGEGNITIQGGGSSDYEDLENLPKINSVELNGNKSLNDLGIQPAGNYALESEIPTKTSDLTNDSGFITGYTETDPTVPSYVKNITQANITSWNNKSDFSGNYNDLTNKPSINNVTLNGNKSLNDLGIQPAGNYALESDMTEAQNDIENLQTENERLKATLPTTTGEGQDVTLDKTAEMEFVKPPLPMGNSEQEGEPSPDNEVSITNVTGNVEVTISNQNNTESKTLSVSLGNIELCKIGDYQDYFYKDSGKWYVHNAIKKLVLNGSENWGGTTSYNYNVFAVNLDNYARILNQKTVYSNYYNGIPNTAGIVDFGNNYNNSIGVRTANDHINNLYISNNEITTVADFKSWLSTHNTIVYYVLATPTSTEITDTTLISQLEEISKALSYQGQTNITSNTIALFDVEAYQSTKLILENLDSRLTLVEG